MAHGLRNAGMMQVKLDWITGSGPRLWSLNGMKPEMGGFGRRGTGCPSPTQVPQLLLHTQSRASLRVFLIREEMRPTMSPFTPS